MNGKTPEEKRFIHFNKIIHPEKYKDIYIERELKTHTDRES